VTRRFRFAARAYGGYSQILIGLHAHPESVFLVDAPFISPGHAPTSPGLFYGIIPSLEAWR